MKIEHKMREAEFDNPADEKKEGKNEGGWK